MQQDHQHIDKKLRELESQSLPDLSKIDEHWQQLKNNLQPVNSNGPARTPRKYGWWTMAAAAIISILFIAIYTANDKQDEKDTIEVVQKTNDEQIARDTIPASTGKKQRKPSTAVASVPPKKHVIPKDSVTASPKKNPTKKLYGKQVNVDTLIRKKKNPTKAKPAVSSEERTADAKGPILQTTASEEIAEKESPSYAVELETFFSQLEKEAQEFVIDSKRDTILLR